MDFKRKLAIVAVTTLALTVVAGASFLAIKNSPGIAAGVHFESTDLSGMSKAQAAAAIDKAFAKNAAGEILLLHYGTEKKSVSAAEIKLSCNGDIVAAAAAKIGNDGNFIEDLAEKLTCAYWGKNVPLQISYNQKAVAAIVAAIAKQLDQPPIDAYCTLHDGMVTVVPSHAGRKVEQAQLLAQITKALQGGKYPQTIQIPVAVAQPPVQTADLQHINAVLASYTTYFRTSSTNRARNVDVAAQALDRTLVKPNTIFSFNTTVGPRGTANGYKAAPVIIDGKLVPGIGGGVCQVSSTLYNAILLANLMPIERIPHYLPVSYVQAGCDATVAYGVIDFRFKNNLKHNIYILTAVKGRELTIYVLGNAGDRSTAKISLSSQAGEDGVSVYRVYSKNGRVLKKEFLHTDK